MRDAGALNKDVEAKTESKDRGQMRDRAVGSDPVKDYRRQVKDLEDARGRLEGTAEEITDADFERSKKKLRQTAVDQLMSQDGQPQGVSPIGAMAAGSEAAQRMIAQTILSDPKLELQRAANAMLDAIVANTSPDRLAAALQVAQEVQNLDR
jgi:hypothetical protein